MTGSRGCCGTEWLTQEGVTAGAREGNAGLDVRGYQSETGVHGPGRTPRSILGTPAYEATCLSRWLSCLIPM